MSVQVHYTMNPKNTIGKLMLLLAMFVLPLFNANIATAQETLPPAYVAAVKQLQENKFGENDIRSFVYHIFSMYDYHVPVKQFYPYLVKTGLEMQFPEGKLQSQRDFEHWYDVSVGENIKTNTHTIEQLQVTILGQQTYQVDLVVWWQAETRKGEYLSYRFQQKWIVVEDGNSLKIQKYIVQPAK